MCIAATSMLRQHIWSEKLPLFKIHFCFLILERILDEVHGDPEWGLILFLERNSEFPERIIMEKWIVLFDF